MTRLLAVDPGPRSGWALFDGFGLIGTGTTLGRLADLSAMTYQIIRHNPALVVCEVHGAVRSYRSGAAAVAMIESIAAWRTAAASVPGVEWRGVHVATWRAKIGVAKLARMRCRKNPCSDCLKRAALEIARSTTGWTGQDPNEAEAVCIGLYAVKGH